MQNDWITAQRNDEYCKEIIRIISECENEKQEFQFDNAGLLVTYDGKIVVPKEKIEEILR